MVITFAKRKPKQILNLKIKIEQYILDANAGKQLS